MTKPHNPPAFPSDISNNPTNLQCGLHPGMTLRDCFANTAMQAILARMDAIDLCHKGEDKTIAELISENAYFMADAMLAERAKYEKRD